MQKLVLSTIVYLYKTIMDRQGKGDALTDFMLYLALIQTQKNSANFQVTNLQCV